MVSGKSNSEIQHDDILTLITEGSPDGGVSGLSEFFGLGTSADLVTGLIDLASTADIATQQTQLAKAAQSVIGDDPISKELKRLVLDTVTGAYLSEDLMAEFVNRFNLGSETNVAQLLRVFEVYGGQRVSDTMGMDFTINEILRLESDTNINKNRASKETPGLVSYVVKPVGISPGTKNTAALSLFMNTIPTTEFSRAMPYLDMTVQTGRSPLSIDGRLNSPSQLKFTLGASKVEEGSADFDIASAGLILSDDDEPLTRAGMELFLSPQVMAPTAGESGFAELDAPSLRPTAVLDPFRPVISIDSISINVAASMGFMSFKTADVELILHDRSRLSEVADFVKPDLYSRTEFLLEYGWHHPDGVDYANSPFGALLNAMRVKEKYGIVNSSFAFQDNGEVRISLQLAMKGANEYKMTQVGTDEAVQGALRDMEQLQQRIAEIRSSIAGSNLAGNSFSKSIFSEQILEAAQSTIGNPTISKSQRRKIQSIISTLRKGASFKDDPRPKELADVLQELYISGPDGRRSAVERFETSVANVINKKFAAIDGLTPRQLTREVDELGPSEDAPVLDPWIDLSQLQKADLVAAGKSKFVSFGKVFMKFVAEPLAASHRFDEVQVLFYPMNNGAGAARNKSVASFLIPRDQLRREFDSYIHDRRAANISVGEFQNFINGTFIDNVANPSYGMATIYKQVDDNGVKRIVPNKSVPGRDKEAKAATMSEQKLIKLGVPNGKFVPPHVDLHIEALPSKAPRGNEGEDVSTRDDRTILRIHVFDKVASAYETHGEMLKAVSDEKLSSIGFLDSKNDKDEAKMRENALKILDQASALDIIEAIDDSDVNTGTGDPNEPVYKHYIIKGGPRKVKEFVMSTAPYIIYGSQNTAVESLELQSIQDPALSTVNILRTNRAGFITPEGHGKGGVPLKTIPARASITTQGCPLLSFMQQFFIDAQTGTDLDQLYSIVQLNHKISVGEFKSSFDVVPINAYGKYESTINKTEQAIAELERLAKGGNS